VSPLPGVRQDFEYLTTPGQIVRSRRVLLVGMRLATASAANDLIPRRIVSRTDSQLLAGAGSQLDLMTRAALETGEVAGQDRPRGGAPELWGMNIAPLAGIDIAVQTLTYTGTASTGGQIVLYANDQTIIIEVAKDDAAADVAGKVKTELDRASPNLGFTFGVVSNVITATARIPGLWGEELYLEHDFQRVGGLSVAVARGTNGTAVPDIEAALAASLEIDYDCVVLPTGDAAARADVAAHTAAAWAPASKRYRIVVVPFVGTLTAAAAATPDLNDRYAMLTCAEKNAGAGGVPWASRTSSRSHDFEVAAAVGARMYSQEQVNFNYNGAALSVYGRPNNVDTAALEVARDAGVCVVLKQLDREERGFILDPVATYFQDPTLLIPDRKWQPIEIARVVQTLARSFDAELGRFSRLLDTADEVRSARAAVKAVLTTAEADRLIRPFDEEKITGETEVQGNSTILRLAALYQIITGIDVVEFLHRIER